MIELWLKFTDESGEPRRIPVDSENYLIGRHSGNDLSVADGKLSREHLKIERFGEVFVVSDLDSSNGTTLNGKKIVGPAAIENADVLNLGGGLKLEVEFIYGDFRSSENDSVDESSAEKNKTVSAATALAVPPANSAAGFGSSRISTGVFWLAPVFGLLIFVLIGGLFFVFSGNKREKRAKNAADFVYSTDKSPVVQENSKSEDSQIEPLETKEKSVDAPALPDSEEKEKNEMSAASEREKIASRAADFMRLIAFNDPKPFVTGEQTKMLEMRLSQFKNSSALAENINAVNKNKPQFEALAGSKNLKPQFLAVAALTKLDSRRGDPLATAKAMLPALSDLKATLDNKLADDNLLIIAGYAKKEAGSGTKLQNVIEGLSKSSQTENITPREIRTVWFLRKMNKLTDTEFDFALAFLAIGTISQNPKEFNVDAEPLIF